MSKVARLREMREANYAKPFAPVINRRVDANGREWIDETAPISPDIIADLRTQIAKENGAKGGKSKSPGKAASSKANGKKGGRPKTQATT